MSAEEKTLEYLRRIDELDAKIGAFIYLDRERAPQVARSLDRLREAGTVLSPLHGSVVAIKDHVAVTGMPTRAGSEMPIEDLVPPEGPFVRSLRDAGCVIIGKTRATEFALGTYNLERRTPWNPCDPDVHRIPGGSSNGSACAVAASFCDFAIGTDTGGSVREPAALCGLVGYRPTPGVWSIEGVFPLSPLLDTIGPLTRGVGATIQIFEALTAQRVPDARIDRLRFGRPSRVFFDDLDPDVKRCTDEAIARLERAGVRIDVVELPELDLVDPVFAKMITADLVATLGRERVETHLKVLDSVVRERIAGGLEIMASDYIAMVRRCAVLAAAAAERMRGFDAWITPTSPTIPLPVAECKTIDAASAWNRRTLRNTRPGNVFGQCGISLPIGSLGSTLPVGLQLLASGGDDARLLAIARCVEDTLRH
ncbi:MAG TPA: amidase [Candidatus Acidoferrales bacterium]|nr:amidase [Candidatus Acidoferrales bacterium]